MRIAFVCLLLAASAVACGPGRGLRLERAAATSDRRPPADTLIEIDPKTGNVIHVVRLADPGPVAMSGPSVWVASPRARTVFRIDARSTRILATTTLTATPVALAPGPAGSVWVLTSGASPAVIQLDAETGRVAKRRALAPCCPGPSAIASAPSGVVWVAGREGVLQIDPSTGRKTIIAPHLRAVAIATTPGARAFVSNGWDAVTRLPAAVLSTITLKGGVGGAQPAEPTGLVYTHGTLWIIAAARRSVIAFNRYSIDSALNVPSALIKVGRAPNAIAYGEGSVWVANRGDGTISQINATSERVVRTIHLGYRPGGIAVGAGAVWATTHRVSPIAAATGLLAFDDHGQIYTSRPDGSARTQLTRTRWPLQNVEPAWSPDGRHITFLRVRRGKQYPSGFAVPDITPIALYVMNADGTRQRRISHTDNAEGSAPAWSPDGTKIAYSAGNPARIYTIAPDGTHRTRVAGVPAKSYDVAWSPDGTQIGFDSNAHMHDEFIFNLYTIQSDGTRLQLLTRIPSQYIQWSPDGRQIIFNRYEFDHAFLGEYIAPASGGPGVRLVPATHKYTGSEKLGPAVVSWSPDGGVIAVSGLAGATPPAIYIANADGTGLSYVTRGNDATWRPVP